MPRSDYLEILDEAEALEKSGTPVWDLEAECARLGLVLDEVPMDERGFDRVLKVAYRKAALRAHPDKHPPERRAAAEAEFKKVAAAHEILMRVVTAVRAEAESGESASMDPAEQRRRVEAERAALERSRLADRLRAVVSLNGVSAGFNDRSSGHLNEMLTEESEATMKRTRRDLEAQMVGLLARCGEACRVQARRRRRRRFWRRVAGVALGVLFLWFLRKRSGPATSAKEELRELAEGLRAAIRFMGHELASAIGRPEDGEEMADDLEAAFLEGRMRVTDAGGLEVLVPDDEEPGVYYKLNMSSNPDGSMAVWTEGADGERMDVDLAEMGADEPPPPGMFGLTADGAAGTVTIVAEEENGGEGGRGGGAGRGGKKSEKKKGGWERRK